MDAKKVFKSVVHATLEYGCGSVFGDLASAVMPYGTKPAKRLIKKMSAELLGTYAGAWCAEKLVADVEKTVKEAIEDEEGEK